MKATFSKILFLALALAGAARAADLATLWAERTKCTVAVEYVIVNENDRRPTLAYGTVIDAQGTIILPTSAIDQRLSLQQLQDFKVYVPGDATPYAATYLGEDLFTGWHFVRVEEKARSRLVPVTTFAAPDGKNPTPALAEELWGIGLRPKEEDFLPYILESRLVLTQLLPQRTGVTQQEVAGPGLPVFNRDGVLVGLALSSGGQTYMQFSQASRGGSAIILVDVEESSLFQLADEVLPYLGRIPKNVNGRPLAWAGFFGLEPMDRDVANFLHLSPQSSGAVVSEILENSPAEKAGMKARDIIVAIDGQPLPHFRPDHVVVDYVDHEMARHVPGDTVRFTVLRGADRLDLKVVLGDEPKLAREADRTFFDHLGFTAREFVYGDAVSRREKVADAAGVIVHYVRPNGPAALAGLETDDWIQEVDGVALKTYADSLAKLSAIENDPQRREVVLLVNRGGETAILRVKLNQSAPSAPVLR